MDRDTAIGICLDHIDRWVAKAKDLMNGTANPERVMEDAENEPTEPGESRLPRAPEGEVDLETASREEMVEHCIQLGYKTVECKGKRVQTLRTMYTD